MGESEMAGNVPFFDLESKWPPHHLSVLKRPRPLASLSKKKSITDDLIVGGPVIDPICAQRNVKSIPPLLYSPTGCVISELKMNSLLYWV